MTRKSKARKPRPVKKIVPFSDGVGKTLRRRRLELGLSLDEIASETRIQKASLKAIEQSNYDDLPHSVHNLGFVRRYARLLGLDQTTAATKYLLERGPLPRSRSRLKKQKITSPIVGSRIFTRLVLAGVLLLVVGYLIIQLSVLAAPPRLNITQPLEDQVVRGSSLEIRGQTTPGADVYVNGQLIYVNDDGSFTTKLTLPEGLQIITIEAKNKRGKTSSVERSILIRPPGAAD
ncbi:helix-turn-helix domain-containing protein [Candidatus Microgenomates bacterium]|nr:helix-turn-helix domain-containing protein [Candidatus Microgenomates bacterium]